MIIFGIEYLTEDENERDIEIQPNLETALQRLNSLYDFYYHAIKKGIVYPDYTTIALGRLTWKNEDSEEWF